MRPLELPDNWWEVVKRCWAGRSGDRPPFEAICETIGRPEYAMEEGKEDEYMAYVRELGPAGVPASLAAPPRSPRRREVIAQKSKPFPFFPHRRGTG
jgi:hypothetical protein